MTFRLAETYVFWFPVSVSIPDEKKPGKFVTQTFDVQFEALKLDDAKKIDDELAELDEAGRRSRQFKMLTTVVRNWRGVVDDVGDEVVFSEEAFDRALQYAWIRTSLYDAYSKALSGEARRGN